MMYFNQHNFPQVPYPSPTDATATVKSGGCGVCCSAMIVANLTTTAVTIPAMAQYCLKVQARVSGGTDMRKLGEVMSRDYGLTYATTDDEAVLLKHLAAGGMAVANVGGDRAGYIGVFSDAGHYVVVAGMAGKRLEVLDPARYAGKFAKAGRQGKVTIDGDYCLCDVAILAADTVTRTPSYYLFAKKGGSVVADTNWQTVAIKAVCAKYGLDEALWLKRTTQPVTVGELFGILNKLQ